MSVRGWSFVLQWSRVGVNAALFLVATRFLSLAEIGLFATAFAAFRMTQGFHKAGIVETIVVRGTTQMRLETLFALSVGTGLGLSLVFAAVGLSSSQPLVLTMALIPFANGLGAVSEGLLRRRLNIRALAIRTAAVQSAAALGALWILTLGYGVWALVFFAVANATLAAFVSIALARWRPRRLGDKRLLPSLVRPIWQITARDFAGSGLLPVTQLAVGGVLGLTAAGAFQIATRMLGLLDALTLAPLRFVALPQLAKAGVTHLAANFATHMRATVGLAAWVWAGTWIAAPDILTLAVGAEHADAATGPLRALCLFGMTAAVLMPVNQALTARGHAGLVLTRTFVKCALAAAFVLPALWVSPIMVAHALSAGAILSGIWYLGRALPTLGLTFEALLPALRPLVSGVAMMLLLSPMAAALSDLSSVERLAALCLSGSALYALLLWLPLPRPSRPVAP